MTATLSVPEAVRDRLKTYGHAGQTYTEILTSMMNRIDRESFVAECRRIYLETPEDAWVDLEDA